MFYNPEIFHIYSPHEIARILRSMADAGERLRIRMPDSEGAVIATVRAVDERQSRVFLEAPSEGVQSRQVLSGKNVSFEGVTEKVRVAFRARRVRQAAFEGEAAWVIDLPEVLVRHQRREYLRVPVEAAFLELAAVSRGQETALRVPVLDVSAGGITLADSANNLRFAINGVHEDCMLFLPEMAPFPVNVRLRNLGDAVGTDGTSVRRIGCQFVNMSTDESARVLRFVTERQKGLLPR